MRQQVTERLRAAIVNLQFVPGQRLIERELTELTGVSRPTVREALQQLLAEGLVATTPGQGWSVAVLTRQEAADLYAVRALVEGLAGRLFVQRATPQDIQDLRASLEEIERCVGDVSLFTAAKSVFYEVLSRGTHSEILETVLSTFYARATLLRSLSSSQPGRMATSADEMRQIVEAIEARDADAAAKQCSYHVEQAAVTGLRAIDEPEQTDPGSSSAG